MSTLKINTLQKGSKSIDADYIIDGCARSWSHITGTGTVTINKSMNLSSITDNGTGKYQHNFTTSMADALFSYNSSGRHTFSGDEGTPRHINAMRNASSASFHEVGCITYNTVQYDAVEIAFQAWGDLA